jgi:hypothetical protein
MGKSRYGRWNGMSDEWGSAVCLRCSRRVNLNRRGQFRKHVSSPGVSCIGSWEWQDIQKARIEAAENASRLAARR